MVASSIGLPTAAFRLPGAQGPGATGRGGAAQLLAGRTRAHFFEPFVAALDARAGDLNGQDHGESMVVVVVVVVVVVGIIFTIKTEFLYDYFLGG